ncbi:phage minor tail protein L [Enterobacillus tribolii]|uniref:Lambda family phage minor tail protein L n=1 Tax=Enterobacillus tribolii TaxID=1487935 RepID=A0A370R2R6_9GAMM|nr:phage minor tail protein L [Enterobacillus tribolii]MBW7984727.1 phage minor tail protein L [Enterobacillus tribolii]RDK96727.1 lambda family phage minor tail protein L [Enterobacillus tribolii]
MITNDSQKLEPGNRVELIEVDGSAFGADILRFHSHTLPYTEEELKAAGGDESKLPAKSIWWQGQEYGPWPVQISDIEMSTDGQAAAPKLTVANQNGLISALCIRFDDMVQARVIIHRTFEHYLDARNFPGGNLTADPEQESQQLWYIDRRSTETDTAIEFELSSLVDLRGRVIPTRQIHSQCTWCSRGWYRTGKGCDYAGTRYFDEDGNPVDDPSLDVCGGLLSDCKKRFGEDNPLPFGGFPGSALIRR